MPWQRSPQRPGGAQHVMFLDDNTYPFKPNPHFKAWVPVIDNPHCFIIYTPGAKPVLVYHQPVDYWYKPAATPSGFWVESFDIRIIGIADDARRHFPERGRVAFIGESLAGQIGTLNPQPLLERLHYERSWKTDYEIECIRRANARGARGHRTAQGLVAERQQVLEAPATAGDDDHVGDVGEPLERVDHRGRRSWPLDIGLGHDDVGRRESRLNPAQHVALRGRVEEVDRFAEDGRVGLMACWHCVPRRARGRRAFRR